MPAKLVYDTPDVMAFADIAAKAPVHFLVVPKTHVPSLMALGAEHGALWNALLAGVQAVALQHGLWPAGFRTVVNSGDQGGQTVDHLHLHVLGGRFMTWPPG